MAISISHLTRTGLVISLAALSGCGMDGVWTPALESLKNTVAPPPKTSITRKEIENIPYAMITARVGRLPSALLVLSTNEKDQLQWMAANNVSIVTRYGRIKKTVGFENDLYNSHTYGLDPLESAPHTITTPIEYSRFIQYNEPEHITLNIHCVLSRGEDEKIIISEIEFDTIRLDEHCASTTSKWAFDNTYWVDPFDGYVWQSRQYTSPMNDYVFYAVLKPEQ